MVAIVQHSRETDSAMVLRHTRREQRRKLFGHQQTAKPQKGVCTSAKLQERTEQFQNATDRQAYELT